MKVRVEQPFCPTVGFETNWLFPKTLKEQAAAVIYSWEQITGLAWSRMPAGKVLEDEDMYAIEVENPICRNHKVTFIWGAAV